ncbi:tripartite tricarboxylate transporter substrate binding protein [Variovorax sp. J22P240]|uniref:Bug family tripartite tricarboxylate transporter substrate binding protein n=1 Tax=unclassified Variovorax TaxID=663243 RepID=UPI002575F36A|nr:MULTISPECIES: tripartite tricarboxylate transporter substrate binding protein [unclassified Variovorax]MDM0001136.1 tripartite tricarboxylate transporter substrate binding protein [Variovorax sp. J22P240]MDM0049779.1 tripartite tricarboxylate transporter substrate binding protein [Variovorax sp. J22R115]
MKAETSITLSAPARARRALLGMAAAAMLAGGTCLPVHAQDAASYPSRMIRITVPNPAGGTSDVLGRLLAKELGEMLKQPVIVENKAGGNGNIGAAFVAKSAPDGYNLLLLDMSVLTIGPSVSPQTTYNPQKDLTPIAIPAYSPHLLVVRNDLPVKNLDELAAYAKKSGKPPSFGTPLASISQLAGILLAQDRGFEFNIIGYKGGAQALADLAGGQIDSAMASVVATNQLVKGGKVKAIAVTSAKPFAATPGVPTVASQIPNFVTGSWQGLLAPANTPPAVLDKLQDAVQRIVTRPEFAKQLQELGSEPSAMNRQQIAEWMRTETQRWGKVVKDNNIKAE